MLSCISGVQLFATPRTEAFQAPLSMGFSRQEYWGGLPLLSPGDLPDPGIKPNWQADSLLLSHQRRPPQSWVTLFFSVTWLQVQTPEPDGLNSKLSFAFSIMHELFNLFIPKCCYL